LGHGQRHVLIEPVGSLMMGMAGRAETLANPHNLMGFLDAFKAEPGAGGSIRMPFVCQNACEATFVALTRKQEKPRTLPSLTHCEDFA
jgi:hypothetical protein